MSWKNSAVVGMAGVPQLTTYIADGAISVLDDVAVLTSTAGAIAMTLAAGRQGQIMRLIQLGTGTNNSVVTAADGAVYTLNAASERLDLVYIGAAWVVLTNVGTVGVA